MKRLLTFLLPCLILLVFAPAAFADPELYLEGTAGTGYIWEPLCDESIVIAEELETIPRIADHNLVGGIQDTHFRLQGIAPGEAEILFAYNRPLACALDDLRFRLNVTVDEAGNVLCSNEIALPRQPDAGWSFAAKWDGILEINDEGFGETTHRFTLVPLEDGTDTLVFTQWDANGQQLPGVFTYEITVTDGILTINTIRYTSEEPSDFSPAFSFTTTDRSGETITEQIFAEHEFTILNFWEPWCGPCVAEMPFLEKLAQENEDILILGIYATPNAEADVDAVLEYTGASYPMAHYTSEFNFLQTGYVPTTVVVNHSGQIVRGPVSGAMNYAGWCALLEELR